MKAKVVKASLYDFARPIYEVWDAEGFEPPAGYASWMEYLKEINRKEGSVCDCEDT